MLYLRMTIYWKLKSYSQKVSHPAWWCRSFENWGQSPNEVQHLDSFNVKLCSFQRIDLQQKHPSPWKTWGTAALFFTSLLLKLSRRCHVSLHNKEYCSEWFYLFCSRTVQKLNLTYLVFCGLDLFGGLPEWISLCDGSEEWFGQCTKRSTMGEAVGNVCKYPRICSSRCNTATCQMTVPKSRTPAFGDRVLCAFSWEHVPLAGAVCWFSRIKLYLQ